MEGSGQSQHISLWPWAALSFLASLAALAFAADYWLPAAGGARRAKGPCHPLEDATSPLPICPPASRPSSRVSVRGSAHKEIAEVRTKRARNGQELEEEHKEDTEAEKREKVAELEKAEEVEKTRLEAAKRESKKGKEKDRHREEEEEKNRAPESEDDDKRKRESTVEGEEDATDKIATGHGSKEDDRTDGSPGEKGQSTEVEGDDKEADRKERSSPLRNESSGKDEEDRTKDLSAILTARRTVSHNSDKLGEVVACKGDDCTGDCHTAVEGEACYYAVEWAMKTGFRTHPGWYHGLTNSSSFVDFQEFKYHQASSKEEAGCRRPCRD